MTDVRRLLKTSLAAAVLVLPLAGGVEASPIVPFASTGDLFVQVDGMEGIVRVDPSTGAASPFISDAQIDAAVAAAGVSGSTAFAGTNLAFDAAGNLYFTVRGNDSVFKRTAAGQLSVLTSDAQITAVTTSSSFASGGIAFDNDGFLYVVDQDSGPDQGEVVRIDLNTGVPTQFRSRAQLDAPADINDVNWDGGIVGLPNGKIYIANQGGDPRGIIEVDLGIGTVAVTAGQGTGGDFGQPRYLTRGPNGNLFLTISGSGLGGVLEVDPSTGAFTQFLTESQIVAITGEAFADERAGIAFDDLGNFYFADAASDSILKFAVGDPTTDPVIGAGVILTDNATLDGVDLIPSNARLNGGIAFAPGGATISDETFVAAVPEPGTLAIFGVGLAGLGWMRRRRAR